MGTKGFRMNEAKSAVKTTKTLAKLLETQLSEMGFTPPTNTLLGV